MAAASQVIGALLILLAFILAQVKVLDQDSYCYLVLNISGSAVLAILALDGREWGFLLLEGSWAVMSAVSLLRRLAALPSAADIDGLGSPVTWQQPPTESDAWITVSARVADHRNT